MGARGAADRGLRHHRRHPHRRPGRPRRVDRLAVPAPLRLRRLLRPAARRRVDTGTGGSPRPTRRTEVDAAATAADTLVLETEFETADGVGPAHRLHAHPRGPSPGGAHGRGRRGPGRHAHGPRASASATARCVPWVRRCDGLLTAIAGPDAVALWTPVETRGEDMTHGGRVHASHEGQHIPFVLTWYPSHEAPPRPVDPLVRRRGHRRRGGRTGRRRCTYEGE